MPLQSDTWTTVGEITAPVSAIRVTVVDTIALLSDTRVTEACTGATEGDIMVIVVNTSAIIRASGATVGEI